MMSLEIRLVEPRSECTLLQAVAHPSASVATTEMMMLNKLEAEEEELLFKLLQMMLVQAPELELEQALDLVVEELQFRELLML